MSIVTLPTMRGVTPLTILCDACRGAAQPDLRVVVGVAAGFAAQRLSVADPAVTVLATMYGATILTICIELLF